MKITSKNKQLCFSHLQRDLNFLEEKEKGNWATYFKKLLQQALTLRHQVVEQNQPSAKGHPDVNKLEHRLNRLLARSIVKEQIP